MALLLYFKTYLIGLDLLYLKQFNRCNGHCKKREFSVSGHHWFRGKCLAQGHIEGNKNNSVSSLKIILLV